MKEENRMKERKKTVRKKEKEENKERNGSIINLLIHSFTLIFNSINKL